MVARKTRSSTGSTPNRSRNGDRAGGVGVASSGPSSTQDRSSRKAVKRGAPKRKARELSDEEDGSEETVATPPPRRAQPKTSPYFNGSAGKRAKTKAREESEDEPTGMTETESESDSSGPGSDFNPVSENEDEDDIEVVSVDSDELDEEPVTRRKSTIGEAKGIAKPLKPKKARKKVQDSDDEIVLEEGQQIAGRIHPAPKEGWVRAGQISQNTLEFLGSLMYPSQNDRDWFKSHEPWFRRAEKEYRDFVDVLQTKMAMSDPQVPVLPARDICHRIYRDVRFSSDKTPYKTNFAFTTSRSGRRGIWAKYHVYISPGDSIIACGLWMPDKDILQRIRDRLLSPGGTSALRSAISSPAFVKVFGQPKAIKGKRQSIFGRDDELKVAPKGIDKSHPDIDLLKLRSITVMKRFTDEEVLAPDFADLIAAVVGIMAPFVHTLNNYVAAPGQSDSD